MPDGRSIWRYINVNHQATRTTNAQRHAADASRLAELRALAASLTESYGGHGGGAADERDDGGGSGGGGEGGESEEEEEESPVRFASNLSMSELYELYGRAAVGLHTMWNEHFGIGVVEMLAAGVATIAHRSGGPALDIIDDGTTGLLADSDASYAEAMAALLLAPGAEERRARIAAAGRAAVARRFGEAAFAESLVAAMRPLME